MTYQDGYEAAYREIYAAIDSDDHPANCGTCRACGVMRTVIEDMMITLSGKLSQDEFYTLAQILARANSREGNLQKSVG